MGRMYSFLSDLEREEDRQFWLYRQQCRGLYADPEDSDEPTYFEVCNDPLLQQRNPAR